MHQVLERKCADGSNSTLSNSGIVLMTVHQLAPNSGVSEYVIRMADALADIGYRVTILSWQSVTESDLRPSSKNVSLVSATGKNWLERCRSYISYENQFINSSLENGFCPIVHDHGVWLPSNIISALIALAKGVPLVVSAHGMLTKWAFRFRGLKKKIVWYLVQRHILCRVSLLHSTSDIETCDLKALLPNNCIVTMSLGVARLQPQEGNIRQRRVLFFSRLHPKKGLDDLIKAWASINPTDWRLTVAGTDSDNYLDEMIKLANSLGIREGIDFVGPLFGKDKWKLFDQSMLFVLPTHSENFGMVIAEALISGVPVITTKEAPWKILEEYSCGWWIDRSLISLEGAIRTALALPAGHLAEMGERGKSLMNSRYSWQQVAGEMSCEYQKLISRTC